MMKKVRIVSSYALVFACCMFCGGQAGFAASNVLDYKAFPNAWQSVIDNLVSKGDIPGTVVLLKSPEWGVRVGVAGKANLETNVIPAPDMHFRVGSITKMFTTMIMLQLEEEGLVRLDDTIDKYLTGEYAYNYNADKITIQNCLQMTSGLKDYLEDPTVASFPDTDPSHYWSPLDLLNVANTLSPYFVPGDTYPNPYQVAWYGVSADKAVPRVPLWYYANVNMLINGLIIEKVTGQQLADVMKARIFDKIGMDDTYFANDLTIPDNMIHGYSKEDANQQPKYDTWMDRTLTSPSYAWAAGAIISTPWDLLHFLEAVFKSEDIINDGTKRKWMRFVSAESHWLGVEYGVGGLMQVQRAYGDCRGHGGAFIGYHNVMYYFYDTDTFFIDTVNTWDSNDTDNGHEVDIMDGVMSQLLNATNAPTPANGSSNSGLGIDGSLTLKWQPGRIYGDHYEVYVGTDADVVDTANASSSIIPREIVLGTSFTKQDLKPKTKYYWRVDTYSDQDGLLHGPLWSFTTGELGTSVVQNWQNQ